VRILWFGTYSRGGGYPRSEVLIDALRSVGEEVVECHVPLFRDAREKIAAASTKRGFLRFGLRAGLAWARLAARFFRAGPRDVVVVGYTGHVDLYLARALSVVWRRPIALDAFLSPWDTVVHDRRLLAPASRAARALWRLERGALRLSDLVLTDTRAHADYMAETFGVAAEKFLPVPVGSLVRVPVAAGMVGGGGGPPAPPTFTAFFCGTFVPLQGLPYILDAAELAPEITFEILGDGPDGDLIEEEVELRGMANVRLDRRFVPREVLEERLALADCVLGVFGTGPKTGRVIPCKVYDGLAAGLPVVTGDGEAPREMLHDGENALLVDRSDPAHLVAALRRLRDEPGLAERLRAGAARCARERFSAPAIGLRLRAAFAELSGR